MKQGVIEKAACAPTAEQLGLIAQYCRRELKAEELYVFSLVLCDNEIDRDCERFSAAALDKLAELFAGKTGIFDHDPSGRNQTARIFRCWVDRESKKLTRAGEQYVCLRAEAYMARSESTADLILEIDAGIKKEVSVGCAVAKATCSVCGADRRTSPCQHRPGKSYRAKGGETLCHTILEQPTDAYEWSFVAVPSQPAAGVTKGRGTAAARQLTPEQAVELMKSGELHLTAQSAGELADYIAALGERASAGEKALEARRGEIVSLTLLADKAADAELIRRMVGLLSVEELDAAYAMARRRADKEFPPLVQTAPPPRAENSAETNNKEFRI